MAYPSIWPDIIIGVIIAYIRIESALEVYGKAKTEYHQAKKTYLNNKIMGFSKKFRKKNRSIK